MERVKFHDTVVASGFGREAVCDYGDGRYFGFRHPEAARMTAQSDGLPGFWRLKERKA